jgi:hypothetical protein
LKAEIVHLIEKPHKFSEIPSAGMTVSDVTYSLKVEGSEGIHFRKQDAEELTEAFININPKKATALIRPNCFPEPMMLVVDKEVITYPHTRTTIYTVTPVVLQLVLIADGTEYVLDEQKEERVLQTHYGPVDGGVTCLLSYVPVFWREEEVRIEENFAAIVPITMVNSLENLHTMGRIVLFTDYLDLYLSEGNLYTNPVSVRILSEKEANVDYQDRSPRTPATKLIARKKAAKAGRTVKQYFGQKSKAAQEYGL